MTRLRRSIIGAALAGIVLWQAGTWYVERPAREPTTPPPTCGTYVDAEFLDALPMLRAQAASILDERGVPGLAVNDFSVKWASGGFLSTVDDLARFGSTHVKPAGFLRAQTIALLTRPRSGLPPIFGYGLG